MTIESQHKILESGVKGLSINEPKYVPAPDHKQVYTNGSRISLSPWDFRVVFSSVKDNLDGVTHEDQVTVIMSPQHAKVMLSAWTRSIKLYEDMFGEIPDLGPLLDAAKKADKEISAIKGAPYQKTPARRIRIKKPAG